MSAWFWPTTADIGMRVFANSYSRLLIEAAHGIQTYLLSENSARTINSHVRHTGEWRVQSEHSPFDYEFLYMAWLDEVLYRSEVKNQWFMDGMVKIERTEEALSIVAQVSWVDASEIEREVEIKAVTTHNFVVSEVPLAQPSEVSGTMFLSSMDPDGTLTSSLTFEVGEPRVDVRFARPNPQASSIPDPHSTHGPR